MVNRGESGVGMRGEVQTVDSASASHSPRVYSAACGTRLVDEWAAGWLGASWVSAISATGADRLARTTSVENPPSDTAIHGYFHGMNSGFVGFLLVIQSI